jgi:hypothetical protein
MEDRAFELLGLGVPFYLAAATYAVFAWLDNNASDDATKIVSLWLHGRSKNKPDLGNLIINTFDRIYTSPLLTFRAFGRSAIISIITWIVVFFVPWLARTYPFEPSTIGNPKALFAQFLAIIFIIVLSDYTSLLFVRHFLRSARSYPIRASIISSIIGLVLVAASFVISAVITFTVFPKLTSWFQFAIYDLPLAIILAVYIIFTDFGEFVTTMLPALIIHLWLPLFVLSSLLVKLLYLVFRAVEKAQWFLKQGDAHPLKAIGIVATIIVFGSAVLVKEAWALLGFWEGG